MSGGERLGALWCGNYGEDELVACRRSDGAVELALSSGGRWTVHAQDALEVASTVFGDGNLSSMETTLALRQPPERRVQITHFELNTMWGGTHEREVLELVQEIAKASGCTVEVSPTGS